MLNYLYKYRYKIYNFSQNDSSTSKNIVRGSTLVCLTFVTEKSDDLFFEELSKLHVFGMRTSSLAKGEAGKAFGLVQTHPLLLPNVAKSLKYSVSHVLC